MILTLRQRHRRMFAVIGVLLPIAFVVGIAARKAMPLRATPSLAAAFRDAEVPIWKRGDLFSKVPVRLRLLRGPMSSYYAVDFSADGPFAKPDLLVYWVADNSTNADALPDNALLLGAFDSPGALQLPPDAERVGGTVILYSLADHEIVDWSKPISFNGSTK